jgi:hypothetical protein
MEVRGEAIYNGREYLYNFVGILSVNAEKVDNDEENRD